MPPLAQIAIRQAPQLAANIIATIEGRPTTSGGVAVQGILVPLGRHRGVAKLKGLRFEGFFAWAMWRAIYLLKTPGWRRRFRVMMDWFINMFCKAATTSSWAWCPLRIASSMDSTTPVAVPMNSVMQGSPAPSDGQPSRRFAQKASSRSTASAPPASGSDP